MRFFEEPTGFCISRECAPLNINYDKQGIYTNVYC